MIWEKTECGKPENVLVSRIIFTIFFAIKEDNENNKIVISTLQQVVINIKALNQNPVKNREVFLI